MGFDARKIFNIPDRELLHIESVKNNEMTSESNHKKDLMIGSTMRRAWVPAPSLNEQAA
jgi:hypothetical protein